MPKSHRRDDYDFTTPTARADARRRSRSLLTRLLRLPGRFSLRMVAVVAIGAVCVGGIANALFLQDAPHPAPIFGEAKTAAKPLPKISPVEPPERPKLAAAPSVLPAPVPPLPVPTPPQRAAGDDIGSLIRANGLAPRSDAGQVTAVQKALAMRGFEIGKADGVIGPSTKFAIEKFERQTKLPVTGDVSPRLMRALGVQTASR